MNRFKSTVDSGKTAVKRGVMVVEGGSNLKRGSKLSPNSRINANIARTRLNISKAAPDVAGKVITPPIAGTTAGARNWGRIARVMGIGTGVGGVGLGAGLGGYFIGAANPNKTASPAIAIEPKKGTASNDPFDTFFSTLSKNWISSSTMVYGIAVLIISFILVFFMYMLMARNIK